MRAPRPSPWFGLGGLCGAALVGLLILPLLALALSSSARDLWAGISDPRFAAALWLSLRTTSVSLVIMVCLGTPLAWWLATSPSRSARIIGVLVDLPIVVPPAVVGVALLQTFGRRGLLGPALGALSISVPFTSSAVVIAQIVVASPFFVQATANAFREIDPSTIVVARTLGATRAEAIWRIAVPAALPGIVAGASLAWARALGEFGATLLFAGNMVSRTQTIPLAIFSALESDVRLAVTFSLALVGVGVALLAGIRFVTARPMRLT